jgi:hypothetical protein
MAEVYKITNNLTNKSYIGYTSKSSNQRLDAVSQKSNMTQCNLC